MYKLYDVIIEGFWGQHQIKTKFHEDINIFIGKNGTGKSTFMYLLQAVLSVDLDLLSNLQFESIIIRIKKGKSIKKIQVVKKPDELLEFKSLSFQLSTSKYEFPILSKDLHYGRYRSGRLHPKLLRELDELRGFLSELIGLSFLSVYRDEMMDINDNRANRREPVQNSVDLKLLKLMNEFTTYQLQLETEISSLSAKFQKDVLKSMLFNSDFDIVDTNKKIDMGKDRIEDIRLQLQDAYRDLGLTDKKTKEAINIHVKEIANAAEVINKRIDNPDEPLYAQHVTPLTLLRRTRKIIDFSTRLQTEKNKVFKPIEDYLKLLKEFIEGKKFTTSNFNHGGLIVHKANEVFPLSELSSGEKQLIILLTEALLQKLKPTIFIADEPELSLHISWQRMILPSLISLNPMAQVIVATHSPEIVGKWKSNAINMENIIHG